jgi:hypothetical protein
LAFKLSNGWKEYRDAASQADAERRGQRLPNTVVWWVERLVPERWKVGRYHVPLKDDPGADNGADTGKAR